MGIYFESMLTEIIISIISFLCLYILYYFFNAFKYWERRGIPYIKPTFPFGNTEDSFLRRKTIGVVIQDIYKKLKEKNLKFGGYYVLSKPMLMILHPDIIKQVMVKDFRYFQDRGIYHNEEADPLTCHLFAVGGQKWRTLRAKLSPTFTSGKMKIMFHTLTTCGRILEEVIEDSTRQSEPLEMKDIAARYTTDIISSCAFGLECNSLKNPNAEFRYWGRKIFDFNLIERLKLFFFFNNPKLLKFFNATIIKKDASDFFMDAIKKTIEYREKNNVDRNDMLNLLIKLKNNQNIDDDNISSEKPTDVFSFNDLAAQCFVFYTAGFETSSATMSFCLLELSLHQQIQDKLREEIRSVLGKHKGEVSYEAMADLVYMEKVIYGN